MSEALPPPIIPQSPEELTAEWVTSALRARGVVKKGKITELHSEILGEGEGFLGLIVRLYLRFDPPEPDAPQRMIAKLPIGLAQNRALGEVLGAYEREIRFYEELARDVELSTPHCYYTAMDPNPFEGREEQALRFLKRIPSWIMRALIPLLLWLARRSERRYILLLEDLAPARVGDQIAGCTPVAAERILRELAVAQASLWNSPRFEPLIWLARIDLLPRASQAMLRRNRGAFFRQFGNDLPPSILGLSKWLDANGVALMNHLGSPPVTLVHGDYRLDNLFFQGSGDELTVTAVDWQGVGCARGPLDVAYFITGNLDLEVGVEAESSLVRAYHEELLTRGVRGYPFEGCWRDYQLSKLFLLHRFMSGEGLIDLSHERGQLLLRRNLERLLARLPQENLDTLLH